MPSVDPQSVTFWLHRWQDGADGALEQLTNLIYADLRRLAAHHLRAENPGHTLQATALVHELYLRISSVRFRGVFNRIGEAVGPSAIARLSL